ncbi:uncharacterized protein LOC141690638 [Apium graveolens]|uniref:uncharacterized protein LOC141690638 n=1 Tax=Apium graveolens TaxID=4045 RepID=UPI003D7A805A
MHPGTTKTYQTMKPHYWWPGMKKEVAEFTANCLTCQQVKTEHQAPAGSWDEYIALMEFVYNNQFHSNIGMTSYEALYGRKCRSSLYWDKEGTMILEGPNIVQNTLDKVNIKKEKSKAI